jgi:hypothetical protein
VAAHAEVGAVVEEDDAGRRARRHRRREQRPDDRVVTARFAHHGPAQVIRARPNIVAAFGHRRA